MGGGGGGVERSPIKKSWGEGVKIKKKIIGRGVCQILKNMGRGLPGKKKKHRVWGKSQVRFQDTAIKCCSTPLLANGAGVPKNPKRADACKFQSMKFRAGALGANVRLHFYI